MKYVGYAILAVAGYFVLGYTLVALNIIALPLFKLEAQVNTAQGIIQKTYNADNAIYNYEWFKERYQAITAIENKIANAKQAESDYNTMLPTDRTTWAYAQQTESARLHSVVLGLENQREDMIAEYNARAQEVNRNIFQNNLPTFIKL